MVFSFSSHEPIWKYYSRPSALDYYRQFTPCNTWFNYNPSSLGKLFMDHCIQTFLSAPVNSAEWICFYRNGYGSFLCLGIAVIQLSFLIAVRQALHSNFVY